MSDQKKMNVHLRRWEMKDVKHLAHYANNPNIARFLTDGFPHPYSEEDAQTFEIPFYFRNISIWEVVL